MKKVEACWFCKHINHHLLPWCQSICWEESPCCEWGEPHLSRSGSGASCSSHQLWKVCSESRDLLLVLPSCCWRFPAMLESIVELLKLFGPESPIGVQQGQTSINAVNFSGSGMARDNETQNLLYPHGCSNLLICSVGVSALRRASCQLHFSHKISCKLQHSST